MVGSAREGRGVVVVRMVAMAAAVKVAVSGGLGEEMGRRVGFDDVAVVVVAAMAEEGEEIGGGEKSVAMVWWFMVMWEEMLSVFERWEFYGFCVFFLLVSLSEEDRVW